MKYGALNNEEGVSYTQSELIVTIERIFFFLVVKWICTIWIVIILVFRHHLGVQIEEGEMTNTKFPCEKSKKCVLNFDCKF